MPYALFFTRIGYMYFAVTTPAMLLHHRRNIFGQYASVPVRSSRNLHTRNSYQVIVVDREYVLPIVFCS
jgi:hypothetical protein